MVVNEAERKLDKLEGYIGRDEEDVCLIFEEDREMEFKVHNTLRRHVGYWRETGTSSFAISVVENGYVPQLWENPPRYEEKNNFLYRKERLWANEVVWKLERANPAHFKAVRKDPEKLLVDFNLYLEAFSNFLMVMDSTDASNTKKEASIGRRTGYDIYV